VAQNPAPTPEPAAVAIDRVEPSLQYSVLCDAVAQDATTKKFSLIGLFDKILIPSVMTQFFIVNKWNNGQGSFEQTVEFLKPDLSLAVPPNTQAFVLPSRTDGGAVIGAGMLNFPFLEAGVWWVQVKLDGQLVLAYPIPVLEPSGAASRPS
jgi:hypothetical protein